MERPIKFLNLYFPHGTSIKECEYIAQKIQDVVKAGVSEGGMQPTSKYGMYDENCKFSEEAMQYTYGYDRSDVEKSKR